MNSLPEILVLVASRQRGVGDFLEAFVRLNQTVSNLLETFENGTEGIGHFLSLSSTRMLLMLRGHVPAHRMITRRTVRIRNRSEATGH